MKNNYLLLLLLLLLIYYISTIFRIHKNTFYEGNEVKTAQQYGFSTNGGRVKNNGDKLMKIPYAMIVDSSEILVDPKIGDYGLVEIGTNCDFGEERVPLSIYWDGRRKDQTKVGLAFEAPKYISEISFVDLNISSVNPISQTCSKVFNVECRTDGVISYKDGYLLDDEIRRLKEEEGMELETESSQAPPPHPPPPPPPVPPPSQDIVIPSQDDEISQIELDPNVGSNTESGSTPGPVTSVLSSFI